MASIQETLHILDEAEKMEKVAEVNCEKILEEMKINGFADQIKHIKNDEIKHQQIIQELKKMIE